MKENFKKLGRWLYSALDRFLDWIFSEKYYVVTVVVLAGIFFTVLSNLFSPWQTENSCFDRQVTLFHIIMSGVEDILTSVEYAFTLSSDKCIVFLSMMLVGVFVSKWWSDKLSAKYAPNRFCKIIMEISAENIAFYILIMLCYTLNFLISDIIDSIDEYGILIVIIIILCSLVFILPSSLYSLTMFIAMYAAFNILNGMESVYGRIITVALALTINLLLDRFLTEQMFYLMRYIVRYIKEKLFSSEEPLTEISVAG